MPPAILNLPLRPPGPLSCVSCKQRQRKRLRLYKARAGGGQVLHGVPPLHAPLRVAVQATTVHNRAQWALGAAGAESGAPVAHAHAPGGALSFCVRARDPPEGAAPGAAPAPGGAARERAERAALVSRLEALEAAFALGPLATVEVGERPPLP